MESSQSLQAMTDKEIEILREILTVLSQMWMERVDASDRYGGPKAKIPYKTQSRRETGLIEYEYYYKS